MSPSFACTRLSSHLRFTTLACPSRSYLLTPSFPSHTAAYSQWSLNTFRKASSKASPKPSPKPPLKDSSLCKTSLGKIQNPSERQRSRIDPDILKAGNTIVGKVGDRWVLNNQADSDQHHLIYQPRRESYLIPAALSPLPPDEYSDFGYRTNLVTLRDACSCSACVDPDSGQKRFSTADVPDALRIKDAVCADDGSLHLTWLQDFFTGADHTSVYSPHLWYTPWLSRDDAWRLALWDRDAMASRAPFYTYDDFARGGAPYEAALQTLHNHGLIILRNVPLSESAVVDIVSRLGELQNTLYGLTWDVRSKPHAENVAYTSAYLGMHQDLLYLGNVPRLQVLHCLQNTCDGGESLFCDSRYLAAQLLRVDRHKPNSELIQVLQNPVRYQYNKNGHHYKFSRPLLHGGMLWWSPPFQDPYQNVLLTQSTTPEWIKIARKIKHMTEDEANVYEYKMQPGECVIFDNRRILHGRRAFDTATGERWFKGAYVENSSHQSKLRSVFPELARFVLP